MRLAVRARARKRRQEAVVDIYDGFLPFPEEIAGQNLHVAREDHRIGLELDQTIKQPRLSRRFGVPGDRDHLEGNSEGTRERLQIGMIADDADDLGFELAEAVAT